MKIVLHDMLGKYYGELVAYVTQKAAIRLEDGTIKRFTIEELEAEGLSLSFDGPEMEE